MCLAKFVTDVWLRPPTPKTLGELFTLDGKALADYFFKFGEVINLELWWWESFSLGIVAKEAERTETPLSSIPAVTLRCFCDFSLGPFPFSFASWLALITKALYYWACLAL
jgi:hypothetical protein